MKRRIKIGKLRHRIKICRWVEESNGETGVDRERPVIAEVWASIEPMKATTQYGWKINNGDLAAPTDKIMIRTPSDFQISSDFWIHTVTRYGKCWYKILSFQMMQMDHRFMELLVSKREIKDVRADPEAVAVEPETVENKFEEPAMDAPTLTHGIGGKSVDKFLT